MQRGGEPSSCWEPVGSGSLSSLRQGRACPSVIRRDCAAGRPGTRCCEAIRAAMASASRWSKAMRSRVEMTRALSEAPWVPSSDESDDVYGSKARPVFCCRIAGGCEWWYGCSARGTCGLYGCGLPCCRGAEPRMYARRTSCQGGGIRPGQSHVCVCVSGVKQAGLVEHTLSLIKSSCRLSA